MKRKGVLSLLVIALIIGGLALFFFSYYGNGSETQTAFQESAGTEVKDLGSGLSDAGKGDSQSLQSATSQEQPAEGSVNKVVESQTMRVEEDECQKMKKDLMEFFAYLDKQDYIKGLQLNEDTFTHFMKIIHTLALDPPTPAGESLKYDTIIKNIYHFYRVLGLRDLKLILLVLRNEADTMEVNLALFYRWLVSGEKCNQKEMLPVFPDTVYRYAGFLVNSIGGRACLFRRDIRLRLLLNYYGVLIVHEADKRKMNSFGIDITPFLEPLAEEIENYQLLYFRKEYAGKLIDLKNYYLKKRRIS